MPKLLLGSVLPQQQRSRLEQWVITLWLPLSSSSSCQLQCVFIKCARSCWYIPCTTQFTLHPPLILGRAEWTSRSPYVRLCHNLSIEKRSLAWVWNELFIPWECLFFDIFCNTRSSTYCLALLSDAWEQPWTISQPQSEKPCQLSTLSKWIFSGNQSQKNVNFTRKDKHYWKISL